MFWNGIFVEEKKIIQLLVILGHNEITFNLIISLAHGPKRRKALFIH